MEVLDFMMLMDGENYGGEIYLKNGSHGCVNTPGVAVKEIFNTVSKGTRVLVHK